MRANLLQTSSTKASAELPASGLRIALFLEEESGNWHVRRLAEAMRARGADVVVSSLPRCAFDTQLASGIDIPGFDGELPDAVFVRSISQGTLEQITFRLGILHALRESGVRVWNDARAIERCVDKSATTFLLHKAGIPTPRTRTMETKPPADAYVADAGRPLIYKPLFGSQGKGLLRVDDSGRPAGPRGRRQHLLPAGFRAAVRVELRGLARHRHPQPRRRRHGAPRRHLDHQRAPGRRAERARAERGDGAACLRRACGGRRRLRRRRSHPHAGRAAAGARGEQQSLLARTAERVRHRYRATPSPRTSWLAVAEHRRRTPEPRSETCPA